MDLLIENVSSVLLDLRVLGGARLHSAKGLVMIQKLK